MHPTRLILAFAACAALSGLPASAEDEAPVAPEVSTMADQALWCAAAYHVVSGQAGEGGNAETASMLLMFRDAMTELFTADLTDAGFTLTEIEILVNDYREEASMQIDSDTARFTPQDCEEVLPEIQ